MTNRTILNVMILTTLGAAAAPASSLAAGSSGRCPAGMTAPAEVSALLERARFCDHLAGEIGAGGERGQEVFEMSVQHQCDFISGDLARAKKRFAAHCKATADIGEYEAGRPE